MADGEVERSIVAALGAAFPDDAFLGEESGGTAGDPCWVIDPIDGTANFARGLPHWCVAIAFVAAGRTDVGVIYDPNGDLLYSARRGAGALRNAVPIRVSATDDPAHASVDIGYSRRTGIDDFARIMSAIARAGRQRDTRRIGGARARPCRGRTPRRLRGASPLLVGRARGLAAGRRGGWPGQRRFWRAMD